MPNQTTVEIVKEIVRKRIEYRSAYEAALAAKVDELFTSLTEKFSTDLSLIRGETSEYMLRQSEFDVELQGLQTRLNIHEVFDRLNIHEVFDRLHELFRPLGISVVLQYESDWLPREVLFDVHIYKTE